jgi:cobalamin biosynthesis Mg chelatase CobN
MPVKPAPATGAASGPMLEIVGGEASEPGMRPSQLEPAIERPVSPAVVASRIAVVSGSGSAPIPVEEKKPVVEAKPSTAPIDAGDAEEEEEEEEEERRHLSAEEKASRKAAKAQKKAERQAARRAAADAANRAANAPKPKEKREPKAEPSERPPKEERAPVKTAASKSTRPAAAKSKSKPAPAQPESTGSSAVTILLVLIVLLAAGAIYWFVLRKH